MAVILAEKIKSGTTFKIRFTLGGRRRKLCLGRRYTRKEAGEIAAMVQATVDCIELEQPPGKALAAWLANLPSDLRRRLERADLVQPPERDPEEITLRMLFKRWFDWPADRKPTTVQNYESTETRLYEFFGADEPVCRITEERALEFRRHWLSRGKAPATVSGYVKNLRQVWKFGAGQGLIDGNPWLKVPRDSQKNPVRNFYVTPEMYEALLDACPDQDWRTLIALCRIGGLRCDSETSRVRWVDVNWDKRTLLVRSPKTERYEGRGLRVIPLYPELERELSASWERAEEGAEFVLPRLRTRMNLRVQMTRIIFHAGLCPWERVFNNLRASRATELQQQFPAHVVAAWMGHSPEVAAGHYLMVRPEDFARGADTILKDPNPQPTPQKGQKTPKRSPILTLQKTGTDSGPK